MQEDFFVSPITFTGSSHLLISPSFMMSIEVTSTILRNSVNSPFLQEKFKSWIVFAVNIPVTTLVFHLFL